jgi:type IV secretory pathway VirB10-like protein
MDFIFDNLIIIIIAASGLVQWWKSTKEAKQERENQPQSEEFAQRELEEFLEQAERRHSRPAVPPPVSHSKPPTLPSFERTPAPALKKASQYSTEAKAFINAPHYEEEALQAELARQAAIAEQLSGLKQSKKKHKSTQTTRRSQTKSVVSSSIRDRLKNRSELRQAFVLKEFLEKPVGLR